MAPATPAGPEEPPGPPSAQPCPQGCTVQPVPNLTAARLGLPRGHVFACCVREDGVELLDVNGAPRLVCPARRVLAFGVVNGRCFVLQFAAAAAAGDPAAACGMSTQPMAAGLLGLLCASQAAARRLRTAVAELLAARVGGGRLCRRWPSDPGAPGRTVGATLATSSAASLSSTVGSGLSLLSLS